MGIDPHFCAIFAILFFFFWGGGGGGGGREKARGRKGLKVYWISSTFSAMFEKGGNYFLGWGGGGGGRSLRCIGLAPHFLPCLKRGAITSWDGGGGGGWRQEHKVYWISSTFSAMFEKGGNYFLFTLLDKEDFKKGINSKTE